MSYCQCGGALSTSGTCNNCGGKGAGDQKPADMGRDYSANEQWAREMNKFSGSWTPRETMFDRLQDRLDDRKHQKEFRNDRDGPSRVAAARSLVKQAKRGK
jgi:hypothetical protein